MKKLFIPLICLVISVSSCKKEEKKDEKLSIYPENEIVDHHTSQNSLDWAGTYIGTLPCADCSGIEITITLFKSGEFELEEEYIEMSYKSTDRGTFEWNEDGNSIVLHGEQNKDPKFFKVGENQIIHLDTKGNEITGNLTEAYILKKDN